MVPLLVVDGQRESDSGEFLERKVEHEAVFIAVIVVVTDH